MKEEIMIVCIMSAPVLHCNIADISELLGKRALPPQLLIRKALSP